MRKETRLLAVQEGEHPLNLSADRKCPLERTVQECAPVFREEPNDLEREIALRRKEVIEAALLHPRRPADLRDTDRRVSVRPKEGGRGREDPFAGVAAPSHASTS